MQKKKKNNNLQLKLKELDEDKKNTEQRLNNDNIITEKNKKLISEIDSLKKEIKQLNLNNQDLQNTLLIKDITIDKYNEKLKELEEKVKNLTDREIIYSELKEKE